MKKIEWSDFSKYRSALMGAAMLFVMFFHVTMPKSYMMYGVIGLWYSWTKQPSLKHFFKRRYLRIYPAWLIMALLFYIPNYLNVAGGGYSPNIGHLVANILFNWSFWRIDDLTFWFIPSIMMLYTVAPFYMELIRKHPSYRWLLVAVAIVWAVMVQYYPPVHRSVGHVEIFWSRIPIFLLGINCGQWVKEKRTMEGAALWGVLLLFILSFMMCIEFENHWRGKFPLFLERMVYIVVPRTHGIYPLLHYGYDPALSSLPLCTQVAPFLPHIHRRNQSGALPHPRAVRTEIRERIPFGLLSDGRVDDCHQHPSRLASIETYFGARRSTFGAASAKDACINLAES